MHIIDLKFMGLEETIAAFLLPSPQGHVLIECGPYSTYPALKAEVERLGYSMSDIKHLLLTHIHFDHAGAAWALAENGTTVWVHPAGERHLGSPEKLYNSAKMIYGDMMETLWGQMNPIAAENLRTIGHGESLDLCGYEFKAWHTPGHAIHHICWQLAGTVFTGDAAGVKIKGGPVAPPCPPPDINLEQWHDSLDLLQALNPERFYLTHFGLVENIEEHCRLLTSRMEAWAEWIHEKWLAGACAQDVTPAFQEFANQGLLADGLPVERLPLYEAANPSWMSVAGLMRYWTKKNG